MKGENLMRLLLALLLLPLTATAAQTLTPVEARPMAPDFTLQDLDGNAVRLADLRGRPVIVNFWATWCPPCREEMPSMQRAWERLQPEGVALLAVNVGEDADSVFQFTGSYPVEFPILFDSDGSVSGAWPIRGLPTTFVVDPQGRIAYRAIGGREWDDPALLQPVLELRNMNTTFDRPLSGSDR
ncbi:peroxiredoxin family protein [Sedimenticola hydrogenitrophicus]|uniref:peroxiredoxin family protein n=1 Tax=Sedimenticola hydrogenitrophicus TaxID=2967975 RepID=UPI0021A76A19|nr:TlpA disulfide reductase family protein [Sedimenticola hydrogenitrophicus]